MGLHFNTSKLDSLGETPKFVFYFKFCVKMKCLKLLLGKKKVDRMGTVGRQRGDRGSKKLKVMK